MSRTEGRMHTLKGLQHDGTTAFGNRTLKRRAKAKAARKARREQR